MWFANYSDLPPFIPHDHQELKEMGGSSSSFFIIQEVSTVTWKFLCKLVSHANFHCYFVIVSESWQRNHSCKSWFVHDHKIVIEICAWNLIFWVNQKDSYNNRNKPKDLQISYPVFWLCVNHNGEIMFEKLESVHTEVNQL